MLIQKFDHFRDGEIEVVHWTRPLMLYPFCMLEGSSVLTTPVSPTLHAVLVEKAVQYCSLGISAACVVASRTWMIAGILSCTWRAMDRV